MAKPDWQSQNYKKVNPVQKAAAGTLALGGLLAYGAKKAYDAFKNRKKKSDTSATTGIDISKDIKARNKPMPVSPRQRKENQKAIKEIVDSQKVKYVGADEPQAEQVKYVPSAKKIKSTKAKGFDLMKKAEVKKNNNQGSSNNNQDSNNNSQDSEKPKKKKPITTGKTRSDNRSRILNDAASRTGKNSEQPKKKKTEMYSEYPRDVQARLKKIDKEIAKTLIVSGTQAGSKRYRTLRAEKKDLLKNFKNKSIAETMTP